MKKVKFFLALIIIISIGGILVKLIGFPMPLKLLSQNDDLPSYQTNGNSLSNGNNAYVSNIEEFWLRPIELGKKVGKTENGDYVWEIKGQDPSNWVVVKGEMEEVIYRNINLQPVDYRSVPITEMKLVPTQGVNPAPVKITSDKLIIQALLDKLSNKDYTQEKVTDYQNFSVLLISPQVQGMAFENSYIIIEKVKGKVYVQRRGYPDTYIPAGELISTWVNH